MSDNTPTFSTSGDSRELAASGFPRVYDGYADRAWRGHPAAVEQFVGIIRNGPAAGSGADYVDSRYYVDRAVATNANADAALAAAVDSLPGVGQRITATNLAELALGSHLLSPGTLVQVFALYARKSPGVKVFVFEQMPATAVVVQITSAATGTGEYSGKILGGVAAASASSNLTMPMGMNSPASDDALILNMEEDAQSGHRLQNGAYATGIIRGATADVPPRPIVLIRGAAGRVDSPTTLGSTSDASESAETTTWDKGIDGSPVDVYVTSRVVYNASGDQTLYAFLRKMSFDARGVLSAVGAETRVTVDVTEACP